MIYLAVFFLALVGAAVALAAFALGWAIGYRVAEGGTSSLAGICRRQPGAGRHMPTREEAPPAAGEGTDEQRRAFEMMMNYDAADAYGMRKEERT